MTQQPGKVSRFCLHVLLLVLFQLPLTNAFNLPSIMMRCRALSGVARQTTSTSRSLVSRKSVSRAAPGFTTTVNERFSRSRSLLHREYRTQLFSFFSTVTKPASAADEDNVDDNSKTAVAAGFSTRTITATTSAEASAADDDFAELQALGITSRPVGGNWNLDDPVGWAREFGSRSEELKERLEPLIKLQPGDEGYYDVNDLRVPGVTIVRNQEQAAAVVEKLFQADPSVFHACDTEVMEIDLKSVGPVGNGYVTCVSVYSGPDFDYGLGDGPGTCLWIDNLDDACGVLQYFKGWFEDDRFLKVWHNYGFDRHEMWNEGIDCLGFGGDTMHMARLQDSSRSKMGQGTGYGLEALTEELLKRRKKPMKEIFGVKRLRKDGSEGSLVDLPLVEVMQRDPKHRTKWIEYSCYDAQGTYLIREVLETKLKDTPWYQDCNLYDYYKLHMRPFAEVLTDMERRGIRVDAKDYLANVEVVAREDRKRHCQTFREWAATMIGPDGYALNPASSTQLGTLLYGGSKNQKTGEFTETVRVFKVAREDIPDEALEAYQRRDDENAQKPDHGKYRRRLPVITLCKAQFTRCANQTSIVFALS